GVRVGSVEFDMPAVVARKERVVGMLTRGVSGMLKRAGVEIITGHGRLLSRTVVQAGDARYETPNILIPTGSRPLATRSPPVLDSDTVFELKSIPEKIAIIGGGYIGLEFACFFNEISTQVTVYELLPHIAAGADREIATRLLQILQAKGIEFKLGQPAPPVG